MTDNADKIEAYAAKIAAMSDDDFVDEVENMVWLSAFAANNPRSIYHSQCDSTYSEAVRRGKPWLYQRGWNAAYRSCGYELPQEDRAKERADHPSYQDQHHD